MRHHTGDACTELRALLRAPLPRAVLGGALALALLLGCSTPEPSRSLYRWTDASGSVRYTAFPDRIPSAYADTRRVVEPGDAEEGAALLPEPGPLPPEVEPPAHADPLDRRIAELEAQIALDEEALKALISDPKMADRLRSSPELREVGTRLPRLQAELEDLRAQRARRAGDGS